MIFNFKHFTFFYDIIVILKIYENPYKNPPMVLKNQNGSRLGYINLHWFFLHPSFIDIDDVSNTTLRFSLLNILQVVGCLKWDFKQNVYHTPIPHITREYWLKSPSSKLISLFLKWTVSWDRFQKCCRKWTDLGLNKGHGWFLNFS